MRFLTIPKVAEMFGVTGDIARGVVDRVGPDVERYGPGMRLIPRDLLPDIEAEMNRRGHHRRAAVASYGGSDNE